MKRIWKYRDSSSHLELQKLRSPAVLALALSGLIFSGCTGSVAAVTSPLGQPSLTSKSPIQEKMVIETGKMDGKPGWPRFAPSDLTFHAGSEVVLTIVSYDDGTAPLPPSSPYGQVWGTDPTYGLVSGGTETVDGKPISGVSNTEISHTVTIPKLLINIPIPAVPAGQKTVTVQFRFRINKAGKYTWICVAPCGSGATGMAGAMESDGWMRGVINVT